MTEQERGPSTMSNLASEFRDAIAEVLADPDHEQCREAGPTDEANCIAEGLFHRGFRATLTGEGAPR